MHDHDGTAAGGDALLAVHVTRPDDTHATVRLAGRFDVIEAAGLRALLTSDLGGVPHLVIDLTDVSFVDSAGLAVLARARRDRLATGSVLLLRPTSDDAMRVFRLTQFDEIFTMRARGSGDAS